MGGNDPRSWFDHAPAPPRRASPPPVAAIVLQAKLGIIIITDNRRTVPNTDPHTFEASASVGRLVNAARLVVQNGVGYDTFMNTIENAVPDSSRKVIVVQKLLGLPDSTPNPHLWYKPGTMAAVAGAIAAGLAAIQPAHAG
jgi:ABC-type Zn uptake system ZnuABC Zn-binding protein ZnuA